MDLPSCENEGQQLGNKSDARKWEGNRDNDILCRDFFRALERRIIVKVRRVGRIDGDICAQIVRGKIYIENQ